MANFSIATLDDSDHPLEDGSSFVRYENSKPHFDSTHFVTFNEVLVIAPITT